MISVTENLQNQHSIETEQFTSQTPLFEEYQKEIYQLKQDLSERDEERILLQDRLNKVQFQHRRTSDDQTSTKDKLQAIVEEQNIQSTQL